MHFASATELASKIKRREISAAELLDHFLGRVEKYNPRLNAIIWMDVEGARARAKAADEALARGEDWGPLHGLPMTIKESFNLAGSPTTWGRPELKDNIPDSNAVLVDRLLAAGANIFGKTNVPINLADWQSFNEIYGTTNNPWDLSLTPGGSSGGSAAALAAGLTGLDAGSDIGASIRNPAHYCGVFGHKPIYGIVPGDGQALPGVFSRPDIAVVGPLARSAEDLALSLDIVAGPDHFAAAGWRLQLPPPRRKALKDFKVAVMLSDPAAEVEQSYQDCLQGVADALARAGATVSDTARPDIDTARAFELFILLLRAATSRRATEEQQDYFRQVAADTKIDGDSYLSRMARGVLLQHRDWLGLDNEGPSCAMPGRNSSRTGISCFARPRYRPPGPMIRQENAMTAPSRSMANSNTAWIRCSGPAIPTWFICRPPLPPPGRAPRVCPWACRRWRRRVRTRRRSNFAA